VHFFRTETSTDPLTWRLVNLIQVAITRSELSATAKLVDSVRDWRNMIHPAVALQDFKHEIDLEPEARMASGLVCALLRDLRA
jgi:hypothetical protein